MRWLPLFALVLASACTPERIEHTRFHVFGTEVNLKTRGLSPSAHAALATEAGAYLRRVHNRWHAWKPGPLQDLNRSLARGETVELEPELAGLLRRAQALEEASGGRFNPAAGALFRAAGFHTDVYPVRAPPDGAQMSAALNRAPSLSQLRWRGNAVRSVSEAVQIDIGGIAKGAAAAHVIALARQYGASAALLDAGGDVLAFSERAAWRVGLRHPSQPGEVMGGFLVDAPLAIFTSGNYARFRADDSGPSGHVLDPRTGVSATGVLSATALSDDAVLADAAATALLVADPQDARALAGAMGLAGYVVVAADGCVWLNGFAAARLQWQPPECVRQSD